jgi:hypothetical protein
LPKVECRDEKTAVQTEMALDRDVCGSAEQELEVQVGMMGSAVAVYFETWIFRDR